MTQPPDIATEESQENAASRRASGEFVRGVSGFRHVIGESAAFPPEPGRYHLFVALNCPWSHRAALARGVANKPDLIAIDGGSTDSGPSYLGRGVSKYSRSSTKPTSGVRSSTLVLFR